MPTSNSQSVRTTSFSVRGKQFVLAGQADEYIFELVARNAGFYESDLLDVIASLQLESDRLIIDVGANIGNHTVYFGGFFENPILSIEPVKSNYDLLLQNVDSNSLKQRVSTVQCVVWDRPSEFTMVNDNPRNGGTFQAKESEQTDQTVHGKTLDEIVGDRRTALLKIDVEGAEDRVVTGGLSVIERDKPFIVAESHTPEAYRSLADLLLPLGYEVVTEGGRSTNYLWAHPDSLPVGTVSQLRHRIDIDTRRDISRRTLTSLDRISNKLTALSSEAVLPLVDDNRQVLAAVNKSNEQNGKLVEETRALKAAITSVQESSAELGGTVTGAAQATSELVTEVGSRLEKVVTEGIAAISEKTDPVAGIQRSTALIEQIAQETRVQGTEILGKAQATSELVTEVGSRLENVVTEGIAAISEKTHNYHVAANSTLEDTCRTIERARQAMEEAAETLKSREAIRVEKEFSARLVLAATELENALDEREQFETSAVAWQRAYAQLASKLEKALPGAVSAAAATSAVQEVISARGGAELPPAPDIQQQADPVHEIRGGGFRRTDTVRIGIATMPGREKGLKTVLESLITQADEIFVYLNGSETAPPDIAYDGRVRFFTGPDYGDRGKFLFMEGFTGYYLTCDDDIEYPDFYVDYMVDGIERYGRKAIVGWHGSIFADDFEDYYNSKYRRVLSFSTLRGQDTPVHLLGTGIAGFHTSTMPVTFDDFEYPNMADAFLARKAQHYKVPMVVLRHEKGWAKPIEADAPSISNASLGKGEAVAKFDVRSHVSRLVKEHGTWSINVAEPVVVREPLTVAIIGRTDRDRWKKGGILKSCHLTASLLQQFGVRVVLEDIETGNPEDLGGAQPSVVMIYVGDPERPDFVKVEKLIHHHARRGRVVVVNLSVNGKSTRNAHIRQRLLTWEAEYGNRVVLMVFTESMHEQSELAAVKHLMVTIPKTLSLPLPPHAEFHDSEGIFVGDIAKLSDDSLMTYPAQDWLKAIRSAVPEAPIYAVRQYKPRFDVPLDVDEVWPFLHEDFSRRISRTRLMVTPIKYATFEMVPVEVASLGVPVVYQQMPQSLSEYLGLAGVQIQTPEELEALLPMLYNDPLVWRSQSRAGRLRAQSADLQSAAGQMYMRIAALSRRSIPA